MAVNFNRRDFIRGAAATSALLIAARSRALAVSPQRKFAPVKVSRDRVIRELVGLRPYRPEGFRLEAERIGEKLFIHNYGHGGAGITLSWGTASLAVDILSEPGAAPPITKRRTRSQQSAPRFAVLGCGVNGLSTARLLQRRHSPAAVTIYAKNIPPDTTSNIAGGFWKPTSAFEYGLTSEKFNAQFRQACLISHRAFQTLAGPEYGVRWMETYELHESEGPVTRKLPGGNDLYPQSEVHVNDAEHYFGFRYVRQYSTMVIEPSIYLNTLLRDFYVAGGKIVVKEFRGIEELKRLPEPVVFNCTGLGARALFADETLEPVRGQLEVLLPQPEIDYCYLGPGYMFPRTDGIVLGGTYDEGDWSLEPNPEQTTAILNTHIEIMKGLKK
ncbi:MAG TPA: FAD-dependent oxidoreductase [Pyrinomonadaceae bacterium]|nr:FAD-dependent oxidoreductase [Pyrinomonadaceae bacterium]